MRTAAVPRQSAGQEPRGGKAASQRPRRAPVDGSRPRACFTSHLPPEIPRPAPRDVHCARLSAGLRTRGSGRPRLCASGSSPRPPLPGTTVPVRARPRFHLPLRGSAGMGRDLLSRPCRTGFPFHPEPCGAGTDGAQHIGVDVSRQRDIWEFAGFVDRAVAAPTERKSPGGWPGLEGAQLRPRCSSSGSTLGSLPRNSR